MATLDDLERRAKQVLDLLEQEERERGKAPKAVFDVPIESEEDLKRVLDMAVRASTGVTPDEMAAKRQAYREYRDKLPEALPGPTIIWEGQDRFGSGPYAGMTPNEMEVARTAEREQFMKFVSRAQRRREQAKKAKQEAAEKKRRQITMSPHPPRRAFGDD